MPFTDTSQLARRTAQFAHLPVPAQNHFSECSSSGPGLRQTAYLEIAPKCQLPTAEGETDDLSVVPGENLKSGRPTSE